MSYITLIKARFIRVPAGIIPLILMGTNEVKEKPIWKKRSAPILRWSNPTEDNCSVLNTFKSHMLAQSFSCVATDNYLSRKRNPTTNIENIFTGPEAKEFILNAIKSAKTVEDYIEEGKSILIHEFDMLNCFSLYDNDENNSVSIYFRERENGVLTKSKHIYSTYDLVDYMEKAKVRNFKNYSIEVEVF